MRKYAIGIIFADTICDSHIYLRTITDKLIVELCRNSS